MRPPAARCFPVTLVKLPGWEDVGFVHAVCHLLGGNFLLVLEVGKSLEREVCAPLHPMLCRTPLGGFLCTGRGAEPRLFSCIPYY